MSQYSTQTPLAARQQQRERIAAKHGAGMLPIVLEAVGKHSSVNFTALPPTATVADLQRAVREIGDVSRRSACALLVGGCTPSSSTEIKDMYEHCRNMDDGFLYVHYMGEGTVGCARGGGRGAPVSSTSIITAAGDARMEADVKVENHDVPPARVELPALSGKGSSSWGDSALCRASTQSASVGALTPSTVSACRTAEFSDNKSFTPDMLSDGDEVEVV